MPSSLSRLTPFLANPEDAVALLEGMEGKQGEIRYNLSGHVTTDAAGGRRRRIKCTISGWFLLTDPVTFKPEPYELAINSTLVLVNGESELPPLEEEAEDEDYVVLGEELDVEELVEEEILLDLPFWVIAVGTDSKSKSKSKQAKKVAKPTTVFSAAGLGLVVETKLSPFAKLAGLKKVKH